MAAVHSASLLPKCLYRLALEMPRALATSSMVIRSNAFSPSRRQADARIAASRAWYICALNETLGGTVSMAGILCMARNLPQAAPGRKPAPGGAGTAWWALVGQGIRWRHQNASGARLVSRHRSDVVGCAQPSERSARRIACQYRAYWQAMQRRDALRWPARTDR